MKHLFISLFCLFLCACGEVKTDDLREFTFEIKSKVYTHEDKIFKLKEIESLAFTQKEERDPFSKPKKETFTDKKKIDKNCLQPNLNRQKENLEFFSLDNIKMRGTLKFDNQLWAILEAPNSIFYRVKAGQYIGLDYGKTLKITDTHVELFELLLDRNGCWKKHHREIDLLLE